MICVNVTTVLALILAFSDPFNSIMENVIIPKPIIPFSCRTFDVRQENVIVKERQTKSLKPKKKIH